MENFSLNFDIGPGAVIIKAEIFSTIFFILAKKNVLISSKRRSSNNRCK
jgi:hypothetical protein